MKMSLQETKSVESRGMWLLSVLLLAVLVGVSAGTSAYALGNAIAAIIGTSN